MKTLIVLSAMPGSGKSTWAKKYQEEHPHTLIISSDKIRYELTGTGRRGCRRKARCGDRQRKGRSASRSDAGCRDPGAASSRIPSPRGRRR